MNFEVVPAIAAGLVGGVVMMTVRWLLRAASVDLHMHVAQMWGVMFGLEGTTASAVGWAVHLTMSAVIALLYAWGFLVLGVSPEAAWLWGLVGGVIHWAVAGVVMTMMPVLHPAIPDKRSPPGPFVAGYGRPDMIGFFLGHLAYGITVGLVYAALHG